MAPLRGDTYRRLALAVRVAAIVFVGCAAVYHYRVGIPWTAPSLGETRASLSLSFDNDRSFELSWGRRQTAATAPRLGSLAAAGPDSIAAGGLIPPGIAPTVAVGSPGTREAVPSGRAAGEASGSPSVLSVCSMSRPADGETLLLARASLKIRGGGSVDGFGVNDWSLLTPAHSEQASDYVLPVLTSIRSQGGLSSLRAGSGVTPLVDTLPNTTDSVDAVGGAFLLGAAHNAVDMLEVGRGAFVAELNPWYHSLNAGMRTQIVGPLSCLDVGAGASADRWNAGPRSGRPSIQTRFGADTIYVSDGHSALLDFTVDGHGPDRAVGTEVRLSQPGLAHVAATLKVDLPPLPARTETAAWDVERARAGTTRSVDLEVVVNGKVVASRPVLADGEARSVQFAVPIAQSSWVALRLMGAGHSNPVYVLVDNKPIRASRSSVEWSLRTLLQAYDSGNKRWHDGDAPDAAAAFRYAYSVYSGILRKTASP